MDGEIKDLLKKILEELSLLNSSIKSEALNNFYTDFLNTENRKKIYELFNGENDAKKIAEQVGCTQRAVSMFIQELITRDLISHHKEGNSIIPQKSISKIAVFYCKKKLETEGTYEQWI